MSREQIAQYEALPDNIKVKMLEQNMAISLKVIKDIHLNIQHFKLMKPNTLAYDDFYKGYNKLFPGNKNERTS
jgi:hypothetical protein